MENIAIFLAIFAISFFAIISVGMNTGEERYNKLTSIDPIAALGISNNQSSVALSNLYRSKDVNISDRTINIKSVDRTVSRDVDKDGQDVSNLNIYLIFANPQLKKDGTDFRMHVVVDAKTVDKNGRSIKALSGKSIQQINNKYSYELDSGAFVFNSRITKDFVGPLTATFTVRDLLSGKKDERIVTIGI